MPFYTYIVKSPEGKTVTGTIEAYSPASAGDLLRQRNYVVISLLERKAGLLARFQRFQGISLAERAVFARQLATMFSAGIPLGDALDILHSQAESERMKEALGEMVGDIQGGASLSKSMAKYPDVFPKVMVALVEAGEASGKLDLILNELAQNTEKERDFQSKTQGALIYPAIIFFAMIVVFLIITVFVVPRLADLYADIGVDLPLPTKILIWVSNVLTGGWGILLPLFGLAIYGIARYAQTEKGKYQISGLTFSFPVFGKLNKEAELARFSRTLGLLLGAGVPITQALEIVAHAMGNVLYEKAILDAAAKVQKGIPLSTPIKADPNFPPILGQMISVGEETGKLDEVLTKVSSFFESQAEQSVRNVSAALEPLVMIVLGVMVGLLVLSIITPIYDVTGQIH